jgi:hypothetical protein
MIPLTKPSRKICLVAWLLIALNLKESASQVVQGWA